MGTITLLVNDYIGDDFEPSRTLKFIIPEQCLLEYLMEIEDDRTIEEFLESYDSDESEAIHEYAIYDNRVLSEEMVYCDDFMEEYDDYIQGNLNPLSMDEYYWAVYSNN